MSRGEGWRGTSTTWQQEEEAYVHKHTRTQQSNLLLLLVFMNDVCTNHSSSSFRTNVLYVLPVVLIIFVVESDMNKTLDMRTFHIVSSLPHK